MDNNNTVLRDIYENFILEMEYNHPDGERHYGYITRNPEYLEGDIQPDEDDNYVVYDLLTKKWIRSSTTSNAFFTVTCPDINGEDGKPLKNPFALADISDKEIIDNANTSLLLKIKARQTAINEALKELKDIVTINEEVKLYYYSLFSAYGFREYSNKDANLLAILAIAEQPYIKVLQNKPTKEELKIAQTNWLKVIDKKIAFSLSELDNEKKQLDPNNEEYEYEVEEIETIKGLIKDLHDEYEAKLKDTVDYKDVLQVWPPLLLPRPAYIEKWIELEHAFPYENKSE